MPHRLKDLPRQIKHRLLIVLSSVSIALIIFVWALYLNWTIQFPADAATPTEETGAILKTGLRVIKEKIETGFIHSYLYFYNAFSEGRTFTISK